MKALVLAGGLGTRLRPLTHTMPKQLIPIANTPVLHYGLRAIRDAEITDVGMVVDARDTQIQREIGNGAAFGLEVSYLPQEAPLGLAHCVLIARSFLGDADFFMYLGDNIILEGLVPLRDAFLKRRPAAMVMTGRVADPKAFGVAEVDEDGRVLSLSEKPAVPRTDLAVVGAYAFSPAIHQAVCSITPNWRREREITDALGWLIEHGYEVAAHPAGGYWKDTGHIDDLLDCNREVLARMERSVRGAVEAGSEVVGPVVVEEGARIVASRVVGPAVVGRDTAVVRSRVGPYTSIGPECVVKDCTIEHSIVLAESSLQGVTGIRASVIGRSARVAANRESGHRLVLGDHCQALIET
jgi:glucose-1-phosphate thymidylyltransferase